MLKARAAGLAVLVQVVVLYLAEIPVPGVHEPYEGIGISVVRKAYLPYAALLLLLSEPVADAHLHEPLPGPVIGEHVHQVVVYVVRAQPLQLLLQVFLRGIDAFYEVMRELGGNVYLVPYPGALEDLPQSGLGPRVDVGGVVVVDAVSVGKQQLLLRLVQIYAAGFLRKAHAAVAQNGQLISVSVPAVIHPFSPRRRRNIRGPGSGSLWPSCPRSVYRSGAWCAFRLL